MVEEVVDTAQLRSHVHYSGTFWGTLSRKMPEAF